MVAVTEGFHCTTYVYIPYKIFVLACKDFQGGQLAVCTSILQYAKWSTEAGMSITLVCGLCQPLSWMVHCPTVLSEDNTGN